MSNQFLYEALWPKGSAVIRSEIFAYLSGIKNGHVPDVDEVLKIIRPESDETSNHEDIADVIVACAMCRPANASAFVKAVGTCLLVDSMPENALSQRVVLGIVIGFFRLATMLAHNEEVGGTFCRRFEETITDIILGRNRLLQAAGKLLNENTAGEKKYYDWYCGTMSSAIKKFVRCNVKRGGINRMANVQCATRIVLSVMNRMVAQSRTRSFRDVSCVSVNVVIPTDLGRYITDQLTVAVFLELDVRSRLRALQLLALAPDVMADFDQGSV